MRPGQLVGVGFCFFDPVLHGLVNHGLLILQNKLTSNLFTPIVEPCAGSARRIYSIRPAFVGRVLRKEGSALPFIAACFLRCAWALR